MVKKINTTMTKSLTAPEYVQRFVQIFNDIHPARTFVRAKKHQEQSIEELKSLIADVSEAKENSVSRGYPEDANVLLCLEYVTWALINELEMVVAIKEERPNDAWDHLIDAQDIAERAFSAHQSTATKVGYESLLLRLETYEKLLFPEQNYVSLGFEVGEMVCTICEDDYVECSHIKGRPYAGEMCNVRLGEPEVDHIAMVDEPFSKSHRMTQTLNGLDVMTLLPPDEGNPDDAHTDDPDDWDLEDREEVDSELQSLETPDED